MVAEAQQAEAAGFDIVTIPDHIGATMASPLIVLAALARATETIRLGTFVLNNEMRHPTQLAWEVATLDRLSGGRFELGLGAGHTPHEFAAVGIDMAPARVRKERLAEAVEIIDQLLLGETVDHRGAHYSIEGAAIEPPAQERVPLLVGGNGTALLSHAAQHCDIVGLNGLGRTQADGHRHSVKFGEDWLDHQIETIEEASGSGRAPEINALVQVVTVTDDAEHAATEVCDRIEGLTIEEALATPYLALGTANEIADGFRAARSRWGISYFVARDIEALAPVVAELSG